MRDSYWFMSVIKQKSFFASFFPFFFGLIFTSHLCIFLFNVNFFFLFGKWKICFLSKRQFSIFLVSQRGDLWVAICFMTFVSLDRYIKVKIKLKGWQLLYEISFWLTEQKIQPILSNLSNIIENSNKTRVLIIRKAFRAIKQRRSFLSKEFLWNDEEISSELKVLKCIPYLR